VLKVEQSAGGRGAVQASGAGAAQSLNGARNGAHTAGGNGRGDTVVHAIAAGLVDAGEVRRPVATAASAPPPAAMPLQPVLATYGSSVGEPASPAGAYAPAEPATVAAPLLPPPPPPVTVRVASLTKTYGDGATGVEALKGIDLEIRRGEFVAVMGPSGSGKSTLMHILGALEEPSSGTVEIGGVSYAGLDDKAQTHLRRDRIGFVFQFFNLLKTLNAEENVMLPSLIAGEPASKLRDRARELLGLVGLDARRDHLPSQLSGGEQQRVSIARALMRSPQLLLADEPTGNLDSRNSAVVLDLLGRLRAESNHTILMVTHDPFAASRATRVVFLRDGLMAGEVPGGDRDRVVASFSALSAQDST
jgi:putative ABC transport system ATP-binding protein